MYKNYMAHWKRKPQEKEGSYFFNGNFYCTRQVLEKITPEEIVLIYLEVKNFAILNNGIDYFQIYEDGNGNTLYFIDSLDAEQIASEEYSIEDNYCTLLFSHEY